MPGHRISMSLSFATQQAALDAVNTLRANLPFWIDLTPKKGGLCWLAYAGEDSNHEYQEFREALQGACSRDALL